MAGKCIQIKVQTLNLKELEWFMEMGQRFLFSRKYLQSAGGWRGGWGSREGREPLPGRVSAFCRMCVCVQSPQLLRSFHVTNELDVGVRQTLS